MIRWPWKKFRPQKPDAFKSTEYSIRFLHVCGRVVDHAEGDQDKPEVSFCGRCGTEGTWTKVVEKTEEWRDWEWSYLDGRHKDDRVSIALYPIPDGTTYDTEESDLLLEELKSKTMRSNCSADFWAQVWPKVKRAQ